MTAGIGVEEKGRMLSAPEVAGPGQTEAASVPERNYVPGPGEGAGRLIHIGPGASEASHSGG